jgi:hypothetical protein
MFEILTAFEQTLAVRTLSSQAKFTIDQIDDILKGHRL